jgi:hypothetical protein
MILLLKRFGVSSGRFAIGINTPKPLWK